MKSNSKKNVQELATNVNSELYWDKRFKEDWEVKGGEEQSTFFGKLAVENFPEWFTRITRKEQYSICDWGCAEGAGTNVLKGFFSNNKIVGVDFSIEAIRRAKIKYPDIAFEVKDFLKEAGSSFDILFSSNTLEHFEAPWEVFDKLLKHANKFVVLLLPFREYERIPEHFVSFDFQSTPFIRNKWTLIHSSVIDAREEKQSYWHGDQILLIFANLNKIDNINISLSEIVIHSGENTLANDGKSLWNIREKMADLQSKIEEKDNELNILKEKEEVWRKTQNLLELNRLTLDKIYASRGWRLIERLRALILRILPYGSRRRRIVGKILRLSLKLVKKTGALVKRIVHNIKIYCYLGSVRRSGLFDAEYYLSKNIMAKGKYPLLHYLKEGYKEGYDPSHDFDSKFYLLANPMINSQDIPPIVDYLKRKKRGDWSNFNLAEYVNKSWVSHKPTLAFQLESFDKGGLEEVVLSMCTSEILREKYNIVILVVGDKLGHLAEIAICNGIPVIALHRNLKLLEYLIVKLNITIAHLHYSVFGLDTYKNSFVRTIYTIHNNYIWADREFIADRKLKYPLIDLFVAVSSEVKEYFIKKFNIDVGKVEVIPNGVSQELLDVFSPEKRETYNLNKDDYVLTNVSSFIPNKFHPLMIVAMSKLVKKYPKLKLLFVGNVLDPVYFSNIKDLIQKYNLEKHIFIVDFVPKKKLLGVLNFSDCFILPSLTEGFSISAIEAMYFKLPLILSDVGGAREVIKNKDIGIIIKEPYEDIQELSLETIVQKYSNDENLSNLDDLVEAVEDMYVNKKAWREKGKKGRDKVNRIFNTQRVVAEYDKIFGRFERKKVDVEESEERDFLPMVSIMLPVYNHLEYVLNSIESVRNQTYPNWELVILDDGSTDGLLDVLRRYSKDPRIKIYTQKNQKLPTALSHLHKLVQGSLLTWTSADNIMEPEMIEKLVKFLLVNPECSLCYADVSIIDQDGNYMLGGDYRNGERDKERPYIIRLPRDADQLGVKADNFINACFMYRRTNSDILEGRYAADLRGLEDYDYWLRLSKLGKIAHIENEEPLYRYRVHRNTMSEELLTTKRKEHFARIEKFMEYEHRRTKFVTKKFSVKIEGNLPSGIKKEKGRSDKILIIKDKKCSLEVSESKISVYYDGSKYFVPSENNREIIVSAGFNISPLCIKAKYLKKTDFVDFEIENSSRKLIGIHCDLSKIIVGEMRKIIERNPLYMFVFCGLSKKDDFFGLAVTKGLANSSYLGIHTFGEVYSIYASWDAILIPPVNSLDEYSFDNQKVLAWNTGRYLIYPKNFTSFETLPYCIAYDTSEKELRLMEPEKNIWGEEVVRKYIEVYSVEKRFDYLKKVCNIVMQNFAVCRPGFGEIVSEEYLPAPVKYTKS